MTTETEFAICGALVHAKPGQVDQVQDMLLQQAGLEIHQRTDDGRFVITVESDDPKQVGDTLLRINNIDGVLSAAMVYQHCDTVPTVQQEISL